MKKMNIASMLPFLESEDLLELANEILSGNIDMPISAVLPLMDEEEVDKLCDRLAKEPQLQEKINLTELYPFASEEYVDKLFLSQVAQGKVDSAALSFVSEDCLHELVLQFAENPNLDIDFDVVYPFLDSDDISLLFRAYLKHNKNK